MSYLIIPGAGSRCPASGHLFIAALVGRLSKFPVRELALRVQLLHTRGVSAEKTDTRKPTLLWTPRPSIGGGAIESLRWFALIGEEEDSKLVPGCDWLEVRCDGAGKV